MWETTATIEFRFYTEQQLKDLGHQLKHIHDVKASLVTPNDIGAPALLAIGINKEHEDATIAAERTAQVLYDFIHSNPAAAGEQSASLVTIEGERIDINRLSVEELTQVLLTAIAGE